MPLQPLAPLGFQAIRATAPRRVAQQPLPLSEEEQASLLQQGIGALSYVAETLDKPGSAVRGLLAGQPEQLLNLIPFSDTLGITDPESVVSGRELLETYGLAPKNIPGFFNSFEDAAFDVAGFATEVVLDPLLYVTGPLGSLTKAGLKAQKGTGKLATTLKGAEKQFAEQLAGTSKLGRELGTTPAALANELEAGERALFGLRIPFTDINTTLPIPFVDGKRSAKLLRAVTYGGGKLNPITAVRGMFSHTAGDVWDGATQLAKDLAYSEKNHLRGALWGMRPAMQQGSKRLDSLWADLAEYHTKMGDPHSAQEFARELAEIQPDLLNTVDGLANLQGKLDLQKQLADAAGLTNDMADYAKARELGEQMHDLMGVMTRTENKAKERLVALGGSVKELDDAFAAHLFRTPSNKDVLKKGAEQRARLFKTGTPFAIHRNDIVTDYPMGTKGFNDASRNVLLTGTKGLSKAENKVLREQLVKRVESLGRQVDEKDTIKELQMQVLIHGEYRPSMERAVQMGKVTQEQADKLLDDFVKSPNQLADEAAEFAKVDGLSDEAKRILIESSDALRTKDNLSQAAKTRAYLRDLPVEVTENGLFDRALIDDWFDYMEHAITAESNLRTMHRFLGGPDIVRAAGTIPDEISLAQAWRDAGLEAKGLDTFMAKNFPDDEIASKVVDQQTMGALTAYNESMKPAVINKLLQFTDKVTATYKGWLTIPAPAFHGRNNIAALWSNWADGEMGIFELLAGYARGLTHINTRGRKPLEFIDEVVGTGLLEGHGQFVEIASEQAARQLTGLPEPFGVFKELFSPTRIKERGFLGNINPIGMRGVTKGTPNILMAAGEKAYGTTEFLARMVPYSILRKKGYTPAQAAYRVKRIQFDYSQLSKFEKSFMRRVIPFYSWTRKSIPYSVAKILARPGGKTAQTIRAYGEATSSDEYVPAFLREGLAIRTRGTEQEATFFKQAGLPIEDLNKFVLSEGLPDSERTVEKFAGLLHPLITFPVEQFAGRSLWQGRDLKNLWSPTREIQKKFSATGMGVPLPYVDRLIHTSPFSRVASEVRQLADPRKNLVEKGLNLMTGAKFGTYDLEKLRLIETRKAMQKQLGVEPDISVFEQYYVPKHKRPDMEPQRLAELQARLKQVQGLGSSIRELQVARDREKLLAAQVPGR